MILWWLATAWAGDCTTVTMDEVVDIEAPAVLVLGERHAHRPDMRRAGRIIRTLLDAQPVWVALEAVHASKQQQVNDYANDKLLLSELPEALAWDDTWGFPWGPYKPLVASARWGATVIGAGVDLGPKPDGVEIPVPPRYIDILRPAMGGHEIPLGMEARFATSMAWRDYSIAKAAVDRWKERGFLVILTGRGHVEGGKGVNWQLQHLTTAPVYSVVLTEGRDAPCHPGDRFLR